MTTPTLTHTDAGVPRLNVGLDFEGGLAVGLMAAKGVIENAAKLGRISADLATGLLAGIERTVINALENAEEDED